MQRIESLTGLRFLAALGIVVCHFGSFIGPALPLQFQGLFLLTGTTVPLFFVLSGFVLTLQYDAAFAGNQRQTLRRYVAARVARILPLYWALLLITVVAYWLTDYLVSLGGDANTPHKGGSLLLSALALQAWVPNYSIQQFWNAPGWSVSAEVFFYASLPWFLRWRALAALKPSTAIVAVIMFGWALSAGYHLLTHTLAPGEALWLDYAKRLPLLGWAAFALGVVLARGHKSQVASRKSQVASRKSQVASRKSQVASRKSQSPWRQTRWPVLLLFSMSFFLSDSAPLILPGWVLANVLMLTFGWLVFALAGKPHSVLASRPMVLLGNSSYALYLMHWLPLGFILKTAGTGQPIWAIALAIVALVLGSIALHLLVEEPARRWIVRRFGSG